MRTRESAAAWSRGMIPPLGGGGHGFDSRSGPLLFFYPMKKHIFKPSETYWGSRQNIGHYFYFFIFGTFPR